MTDRAERPLLFLDVDGTLLPVGGVQRPSTLEEWDAKWQNASNPHLARIVPEHGPRLLAMPCDLMWATAWMADANEVIAPLLGLPELPVVDLGELPGIDDPVWSEQDKAANMNWKTRTLVQLAAGRPFIWVDDEITDVDRAWVSTHHPGQALLHRVVSDYGLTEADLAAVENWLKSNKSTDTETRSTEQPVKRRHGQLR
jgi:hypothetical protein